MLDIMPTKMAASPCSAIFPAMEDKERTICVLGTARGGTSMVAGVLHRLGVSMGSKINEANNEDQDFLVHQGRREIFEDVSLAEDREQYLIHARETVLQRNREHDVWGWKDPMAPLYASELIGHLRNPIFIIVARDVGAVAQRAVIEEEGLSHEHLLAHVDIALSVYRRCFDVVRRLKRPTLLVSYERALRSPRAFGRAVADITGITVPASFAEWIDDYVKADRRDGSVKTLSADLSAASAATAAILFESLNLHKDGYHLKSLSHKDIRNTAAHLYAASIDALLEDRYEDARSYARQIIGLYAEVIPPLADGPLGLLAHEAAGIGISPPYPDLICAALYLIGFSDLLLQSAQSAFLYLKIAETKMAQRICNHPEDSVLCIGNYGSCLFHLALIAKTMQRPEVYSYAIGVLKRKTVRKSRHFLPDLTLWKLRARDELAGAAWP